MEQETVTIPLTQGQVAVVDAADAHLVTGYRWQATKGRYTFYARRSRLVAGKQRYISMHRALMGEPPDREVDHRDGNGLNNRRANLRIATYAENNHNSGPRSNNKSGYRGVHKEPTTGKWAAHCGRQGRNYLGLYDTPEEAARAHDTRAREIYGAFARLNFPDNTTPVAARVHGMSCLNTSGYTGVTYRSKAKGWKKWTARLTHAGKRLHLGYFATADEAAAAIAQKKADLTG